MTIINDRRNDEQRTTHTYLVIGKDRVLSGWGNAQGGASYAAWACTVDDVDKVEQWVRNRTDLTRVRVVRDPYQPPAQCAHFSVYAVTQGHPALA